MTTITGSLPVSTYTAAANGAGTTSIAATKDPGLSQTAVSLAGDASVVATLGASTTPGTTYDAAGLLNSLVQAGNASANSSQPSAGNAAASAGQSAAGSSSTASGAATSGVYNAAGALQTYPATDVTSNWASILKTNPELAATVSSESMAQAIVGTLSTSA